MKELWACLAAMAVCGNDLNTAEVAYAEIQEPSKVQYICYIRDIPSKEGRAAELALLRRQPKEAEGILLGASQVYRAIKMWINLFQWERALELAVKFKTHVDTVVYFRNVYLEEMECKENNKAFIHYGHGLKIDPEAIMHKVDAEEKGVM
jgi:intraflagellar transport protein 80